MAETGHARNVERFAQLISFVQGYGADYAPGNPAITLVNLQAKLAESQAGIDSVSSTKAPLTVVVNDRQNLFAELRPKSTRIVNSFASQGAPQNAVDDVKGMKRKIDGVKLKTLPKGATGTPEDGDGKGHSASQQSYTQLTEHFDNLIELLDTSGFAPNEPDLTLAALTTFATSLKDSITAVINATTSWSNARITRDEALYGEGGLVALAGLVKKYVKSLYGAESPQFKQISGLEFSRPNR